MNEDIGHTEDQPPIDALLGRSLDAPPETLEERLLTAERIGEEATEDVVAAPEGVKRKSERFIKVALAVGRVAERGAIWLAEPVVKTIDKAVQRKKGSPAPIALETPPPGEIEPTSELTEEVPEPAPEPEPVPEVVEPVVIETAEDDTDAGEVADTTETGPDPLPAPDETEPTPPVDRASELGISKAALDRAAELGYDTELLVAAVEESDDFLRRYFEEKGIKLPGGTEETLRQEKVGKDDWIYDPNKIPTGEIQYYMNNILEKPGFIRDVLQRPGSISLGDDWYRKRIVGPPLRLIRWASKQPVLGNLLGVANWMYLPIGRRILVNKLYKEERHKNPDQNYGLLGLGTGRKKELMHKVQQTDTSVKRLRRQLSSTYRHINKGDNRAVSRIDLGAEIAEVRRRLEEYKLGTTHLPTKESAKAVAIREEHARLGDLGVRGSADQARFDNLTDLNRERIKALEKEEFEHLKEYKHMSDEQKTRYLELIDKYPEWKPKKK